MPVTDVAQRFGISIWRVYQLSRRRGSKAPMFQRIYLSPSRFEISMASVSAYEAYLQSINDAQSKQFMPVKPFDLTRGITNE